MLEMPTILEVDKINSFYGEAHVLHQIQLDVKKGEAIAILGRNGAGKTTLLRSILGLTPAKSGTIRFEGREITHLPTNEIANLGLGWVPDNRRIFPTLTVRKNLEIASKKGTDGRIHYGTNVGVGPFDIHANTDAGAAPGSDPRGALVDDNYDVKVKVGPATVVDVKGHATAGISQPVQDAVSSPMGGQGTQSGQWLKQFMNEP